MGPELSFSKAQEAFQRLLRLPHPILASLLKRSSIGQEVAISEPQSQVFTVGKSNFHRINYAESYIQICKNMPLNLSKEEIRIKLQRRLNS